MGMPLMPLKRRNCLGLVMESFGSQEEPPHCQSHWRQTGYWKRKEIISSNGKVSAC
jgi:hypothetical protein